MLWINYWSADGEVAECKYFVGSMQLNATEKLNILKQQHAHLEKICKCEAEAKHFSSIFSSQAIFKD